MWRHDCVDQSSGNDSWKTDNPGSLMVSCAILATDVNTALVNLLGLPSALMIFSCHCHKRQHVTNRKLPGLPYGCVPAPADPVFLLYVLQSRELQQAMWMLILILLLASEKHSDVVQTL